LFSCAAIRARISANDAMILFPYKLRWSLF
jgi:hypothetical protein